METAEQYGAQYVERVTRAKQLAATLLRDNKVNPKTKLAHKLIYSVFYGVFDGALPSAISFLLLVGRADDLLDQSILPRK